MPGELGRASVVLSLEDQQFRRGMQRAAAQMTAQQRTVQRLEQRWAAWRREMGRVARTAVSFRTLTTAATALGGAFAIGLRSATAYGREIQQAAARTELTVRQFQEYAGVLQQLGLDTDDTRDALSDLREAISEFATQGQGALADFRGLFGEAVLNQIQAATTNAERLRLVLQGVADIDPTQQFRVLQQLTDSTTAQALLPFVRQFEQFGTLVDRLEERGFFLSSELAQRANELGGQIDVFQRIVQNQFTRALLGNISSLDNVTRSIETYTQALADGVSDAIRLVTRNPEETANAIRAALTVGPAIGAGAGAAGFLRQSRVDVATAQQRQVLADTNRELRKFERQTTRAEARLVSLGGQLQANTLLYGRQSQQVMRVNRAMEMQRQTIARAAPQIQAAQRQQLATVGAVRRASSGIIAFGQGIGASVAGFVAFNLALEAAAYGLRRLTEVDAEERARDAIATLDASRGATGPAAQDRQSQALLQLERAERALTAAILDNQNEIQRLRDNPPLFASVLGGTGRQEAEIATLERQQSAQEELLSTIRARITAENDARKEQEQATAVSQRNLAVSVQATQEIQKRLDASTRVLADRQAERRIQEQLVGLSLVQRAGEEARLSTIQEYQRVEAEITAELQRQSAAAEAFAARGLTAEADQARQQVASLEARLAALEQRAGQIRSLAAQGAREAETTARLAQQERRIGAGAQARETADALRQQVQETMARLELQRQTLFLSERARAAAEAQFQTEQAHRSAIAASLAEEARLRDTIARLESAGIDSTQARQRLETTEATTAALQAQTPAVEAHAAALARLTAEQAALNAFQEQWDSIQESVVQNLADAATGVKSLEDALRSLASSLVQSGLRLLFEGLAGGLLGGLGSAAGGGSFFSGFGSGFTQSITPASLRGPSPVPAGGASSGSAPVVQQTINLTANSNDPQVIRNAVNQMTPDILERGQVLARQGLHRDLSRTSDTRRQFT